MTIDTSWLQSFKDEIPHAFSPRVKSPSPAVFTDGQIRLMKGVGWGSGSTTWDDYVLNAFARPISRFFETHEVVILAFDNYSLVPAAKCMTQQKRRKHIPVLPFSEHSPLPPNVPSGSDWIAAISNRVFKLKVIEFVIMTLPKRVVKGSKRLIIDYGEPVVYELGDDSTLKHSILDGFPPLGEADIKFPRYADLYDKLLIDSIDGDTIPIALMMHERRLLQGQDPPHLSVYRMSLKGDEDVEVEKKRKAEKTKAKPRSYEFVDIPTLYFGLKEAVLQSIGRTVLPMHQGHEIHMLVALMCLTGTDFSRPLPQISGRFVFDHLPRVWMSLVMSYDPTTDLLRNPHSKDRLVAQIYKEKFNNHIPVIKDYSQALQSIQSSKLSERVKTSFPSSERIEYTVRNINWVLLYWRDANIAPDPVQEDFGYRSIRGVTHYLDA